MENSGQDSLAPLESLSNIAPSLETTPSKTKDVAVPIGNDKTEVKFKSGTSSSSSSSTEEEQETEKPKIPDGGWGWVVVFASLVASMIADGISFSFGLLYEEFKEEFNASSSQTSWIGSLFMSVPLITGPIMSAFVDKYGCQSMTILGGIISAVGFIISWKVKHIGVMCLTFGVIAGLGLGLCYVTVVVSIAFWFDKKRTLAVGLSAAGTGIGTFVFSPFTTYLLYEFHWRGTTLILAGVLLNMCVCGALMIDPDWITEQNKQNSKLSKSGKSSKTSLESVSSTNLGNSIDINELKKLLQSGKDAEYLLQTLETTMQESPDNMGLKNVHNSVLNLPTYIRQNEKVPIEVLEQLSTNKKLYNVILENYPSLLSCRSTSDKGVNKLEENSSHIERVPVTFSMKLKKEDKPNKALVHQGSLPEEHIAAMEPLMGEKKAKVQDSPPPRNASFPWLKQHLVQSQKQNYLKNLKFHRQSLMVHRGAMINTNKYRFKASSCPNIYRVSMVTLPDKDELMNETGYDKNSNAAPMTIANIGVTNTIGMILLGWAGDQNWMNITKTYAVSLVLCGVSCAGIMYFAENFIMLEICAGLFGVFLASTFSFTPGILVELVPLDRFTIAYGLQLLCMGIGILLGPPYAGHLYDVTQTWHQTFYQAAIWIVISGVLIAIIPYTKNRKITGKGPVEKVIEVDKMLKSTSSEGLDRKFQGKEAILSSQISLYVQESKPNIPDGGWGWFVVFAAFTLNVISEGVTLSFGFLYIEFLREFGASASATSWIGSLFMAIPLLAGPLASALVDKYGCRYMTILGGVTCMIGFLLSAIADSIGVMYFTFGIIGGLSRSLTYVTVVVPIAFWFEKRRTIALGLQASGAGIGTVIFSPITTSLLSEYGWRGTLVIFAGLFANMCVCGMLMKDPEWVTEVDKQEKESKKQAKSGRNSASKKTQKEIHELLNNKEENQQLLNHSPSNNDDSKNKSRSMVNLPTFHKHNERVPPSDSAFPKISEEDEIREETDTTVGTTSVNHFGDGTKPHRPHPHGYLKTIRVRRNSLSYRGAMTLNYNARALSCPNVYENCTIAFEKQENEKWYEEVVDILKSLCNFSLFLELHFLLQSLSTIILFIWFIVPYFYLAEHMTRIGYSEEDASLVISVIGITNTIGMVVLGLVGDRLNVAKTYAICLILCGISVLSMMYFTDNFILLNINAGLFGLFFASCFSLSPALMSSLVPLNGFTMAYGLGLLCEGIGNLIGPPLAGFLFDITLSWELSFYQAGFWIIVSGLLVGTIALTENRRIFGGALMKDRVKQNNSSA
ncbi:hypothetical protein NQ315_001725 [Exocentrus adspersus]|uniref:Major facilitator superfamily (MFS) profile domain-containing protein n=1 Tax=Exocentrus adspersus TaxID=1586481 RepID=A0AAV8WBW4_9CUCU|nr:hypothetical protein NQ315_001725 [Exocentrus adspersus]